MKTTTVTITPNMAADILAKDELARSKSKDSRHRDLFRHTIMSYASDLESANWRPTHQGMLICDTGEVFDGRHRLHAIGIANTPMTVQMTNGLSADEARELMKYIDGGRPRTIATQLWLAEGLESSRPVVSAIRSQWGLAIGAAREQGGSTSAFMACFKAQPTTLLQIINVMRGFHTKLVSSVVGPIAYYAHSHPEAAAEFTASFATGERLSATSPVLWLRRTIESRTARKLRHRIYESSVITCNALLAAHEGYKCSMAFRPVEAGREWLIKESSKLTQVLLKNAPKYTGKSGPRIPMGEN